MARSALLCVLLVGLLFVVADSFAPYQPPEAAALRAWKDFTTTYNRLYATPEEEKKRFEIFQSNLRRIDELNEQHPHATFAVNKFADMSPEEFRSKYLSNSFPAAHPQDAPVAPLFSQEAIDALPTSWDWREKGAVTPVKNQGDCGSCWSFSTTGNVEGQWFLAGHTLVGLSEQNLVDCDHECMIYDGQQSCDSGCEGGLMPNAFKYIIKNGGIDTESSYPYQGEDGTCAFKKASIGAMISNWTMISSNEDQMAAWLVAHGPIAIAADAEPWQFYAFGVFDGPCGTTLDHGILIVGFGEETDYLGFNIKYWIIKNSWGADWGRSGYIYIIRGVGECGLNTFACSSIV